VGDADLVAHNATFDMTFVNYELKQIGKTEFDNAKVIDTLEIAKNLFPGARCNLDALCKRFGVDNTSRTLHGALLDAQLLAEVYLELLGGKEPSLLLDSKKQKENKITNVVFDNKKNVRVSRNFVLSDEELKLHSDFLENKIKSAIWNS